MKNFNSKILLAFLFVLVTTMGYSQFWIVNDIKLALQKGLVTAQQLAELNIRSTQGQLLQELNTLEKEYDKQRGFRGAFRNLPIYLAVLYFNKKISKNFKATKDNLNVLKKRDFYIPSPHHDEEFDWEMIEWDYEWSKKKLRNSFAYIPVSGGAGAVRINMAYRLLVAVDIHRRISNVQLPANQKSIATKIFKR